MYLIFRRLHASAALSLALVFAAGCSSLARFSDPSVAAIAMPHLSGNVHGGQQPISGANILLFEANTSLKKGPSLSKLLVPVTTDASGNFSITADYTCSSPNSLIYIVATGGNPGLPAGTNNASIAEMALLGNCGSVFLNALTTTAVINELTTVAAIEALAPFMSDYAHVGADTTSNPSALTSAFASANSVVNSSTGQFAAANGRNLPVALYNTLADILAACVNTSGDTGATTNCGKLFAATTNASDTIAAILSVAQHPATNVPALFALAAGTGAPFQPSLSAAPADLTSSIAATVPNDTGDSQRPSYLTIDGAQNVWVSVNAPGAQARNPPVFVFDNNLSLLRQVKVVEPVQNLSTDRAGNVWILTGISPSLPTRVYKFDSNGNKLIDGVSTRSGDTNPVSPNNGQLAFDSAGNAWATATQASTTYACAEKLSGSTGAVLLTRCFSTSIAASSQYSGIAVDGSDNVYLAATQQSVIYKFDTNGVVNTTAPFSASGLELSGSSGKLHFDPATNHLVMNTTASAFQVFDPSGATVKQNISSIYGMLLPTSFTLDGDGTLWYVNFTFPSTIGAATQDGTILSPATSSTHGFAPPNADYVVQIQVDAAGNIFLANSSFSAATGSVLKVSGLATAKNQQSY